MLSNDDDLNGNYNGEPFLVDQSLSGALLVEGLVYKGSSGESQ